MPANSTLLAGQTYRFGYVLILMTLFLLTGRAQQPEYMKYNTKNGLGHDQMTFQVRKDSRGIMWFVSPAGIKRFDGYEFKKYSISEGLPHPVVLSCREASNGKMWFLTMSGELVYHEGDSLYPYKFNDSIRSHTKGGRLISYNFDSNGKMELGTTHNGYLTVDTAGNLENVIPSNIGQLGMGIVLNGTQQPVVFAARDSVLERKGAERQVYLFDSKARLINQFPLDTTGKQFKLYGWSHPIAIVKRDGSIVAALESRLIQFTKDTVIKHHIDEDLFTSLHEDQNGGIWASRSYHGTSYFRSGVIGDKPFKNYLPEETQYFSTHDDEGGVWLATQYKGVYYAPFPDILWYKKDELLEDRGHNRLIQAGEDLYASWGKGINRIRNHKSETTEVIRRVGSGGFTTINSLMWDTSCNCLLLGMISEVGYLDENKAFVPLDSNSELTPKSFVKQLTPSKSGDFTWVLSNGAILKLKDQKYIGQLPRVPDRMECLAEGENGELWLGASEGLWLYRNGEYEAVFEKYEELALGVYDLKYADGKLWISTSRGDLYMLEGDSLTSFDQPGRLVDKAFMKVIEGDTCWAINRLYLYKIFQDQNDDYVIEKFRVSFDKNRRNLDMIIKGDTAYISGSDGIAYFNIRDVKPSTQTPKVFMRSVAINNSDTAVLSSYDLQYDQDYIRLSFSGLSYNSNKDLEYRYRMRGVDDQWLYTDERSTQYTKLPPGNYTFEVSSRGPNKVWSNPPEQVFFEIHPPFWATWWFRSISALSLLVIIIMVFQWRYSRLNKKREVEKQLLRLESKALRAQINPHFIFNVLTAIQAYVGNSDTQSSEIYLGKFARLIRMILENSRESFIPLASEIKFLRHYMEMEQMRFEKGRLEFSIEVAPDIDPEQVHLPPMMIQPYVENAIVHGLKHKEQAGLVLVEFSGEGECLCCTITDNGVGRNHSKNGDQNRNGHQPLGMLITRERLELLNKDIAQQLEIHIEDLGTADGTASGTKVVLQIPIKQEQENKLTYANIDH